MTVSLPLYRSCSISRRLAVRATGRKALRSNRLSAEGNPATGARRDSERRRRAEPAFRTSRRSAHRVRLQEKARRPARET